MATSSVTYGTGASSAVGTTYLDGLVSGLNTTDIINQLAEVRGKAVERMTEEKTVLQDKLKAYQTIGAALASLQLKAEAVASPSEFMPNTTTVSDQNALAASADETAQAGTHTISISQLAEAHKIASGAVSGVGTALGYAGDILINGETISVQATWTLSDLRTAINKADCGVSASILTVSTTDSRLILEADSTGTAAAIDLVDANSSGILSGLGLVSSGTGIKHAVTDGVRSDGLKAQSTSVASAMGLTTPAAGTISINGQSVAIDLAVDSLSDIVDRINTTPGIGATASIVTNEVDGATAYSLQIVGDSGTPTLGDNGTGVLTTLGVLGKAVSNELTAALDAQFVIDGFSMTRGTNSVDDAIQGVSIELTDTTTGTETFSVARDVKTAVSQVQSLVDAYNSLLDRIEGYTKYDVDAETGGLLSGDRTLGNLVSELRQTMTGSITKTDGSIALVSSIGITANGYDRLSVDTSVLSTALQSDPDVVARMFGFDWAASTSEITYISSTDLTADSGVAGFAVEITQAATKTTASSASLAGGITVDETLTFAGSGSVTLTAGMTLDEAASALNVYFTDRDLSLSASVDGDKLKLEHNQYGAKYSFAVVSSLDQGLGGTDLGGATAGETQNWANGRDVAGTINGELCNGSGQFLTGRDGNLTTSGLMIRVSATTAGTVGTLTLGEGAAKRMSDYLGFSLDSEWGAVTRATEAAETEIEEKEEDIANAQVRLQVFIDEMREKFTRMETLLGEAQSLQNYLTGQLDSLPSNYMPTSG